MKNIICCTHLSWEYVPKLFALSLIDMVQYAAGKYQFGIITKGSCYMDTARDKMAEEALKYNPDYLLWLDADQVYPGDAPEILMKHIDTGKLIVGGVSPLKKGLGEEYDCEPSVWDIDTEVNFARHKKIFINHGLIQVDGLGLGGVMTSPEVFKILEYPRFSQMWITDEKRRLGVDLQFFANCKKAEIDVWCDTGLIYGHIGVRPLELKAKKGLIEL